MTHSVEQMSLSTLREQIRTNQFTAPTSGLAPGYLQANLVILPADWAMDFLLFCQKNPVACPLIGVTEPGDKHLADIGIDIDISRDVPEYCIFYDGKAEYSTYDLDQYWQDDFVTFVLGCSFSFEEALIQSGLTIRNVEQNRNVSMYDTSIACQSAGKFSGNMVVTMRPYSPADAIRGFRCKVFGRP